MISMALFWCYFLFHKETFSCALVHLKMTIHLFQNEIKIKKMEGSNIFTRKGKQRRAIKWTVENIHKQAIAHSTFRYSSSSTFSPPFHPFSWRVHNVILVGWWWGSWRRQRRRRRLLLLLLDGQLCGRVFSTHYTRHSAYIAQQQSQQMSE